MIKAPKYTPVTAAHLYSPPFTFTARKVSALAKPSKVKRDISALWCQ